MDSKTKINSQYKNQTLKNKIKSSLTNANSNWGVHTIEPNNHLILFMIHSAENVLLLPY